MTDEVPKLLCNILHHECQRDDIKGEWQRDGDVWEMVVGKHVEDSSFMGHLISFTQG